MRGRTRRPAHFEQAIALLRGGRARASRRAQGLSSAGRDLDGPRADRTGHREHGAGVEVLADEEPDADLAALSAARAVPLLPRRGGARARAGRAGARASPRRSALPEVLSEALNTKAIILARARPARTRRSPCSEHAIALGHEQAVRARSARSTTSRTRSATRPLRRCGEGRREGLALARRVGERCGSGSSSATCARCPRSAPGTRSRR